HDMPHVSGSSGYVSKGKGAVPLELVHSAARTPMRS
ncbi:MAG: hypothetical protein QOE99_3053, partial [Actinomycetota bacterium]|nr:hypothetical protein [Actinomycetota bacterium]